MSSNYIIKYTLHLQFKEPWPDPPSLPPVRDCRPGTPLLAIDNVHLHNSVVQLNYQDGHSTWMSVLCLFAAIHSITEDPDASDMCNF